VGVGKLSKVIFVAVNFAFIIAFGFIANEFGVGSITVEPPIAFSPPDGGSILDNILAPLTWAFDAAGYFFQLLAVSFTSVHPAVAALIFTPLLAADLLVIYGMVRGGGT